MEIGFTEATGRMIAAGRMLAGLDQAGLASAAGISAATVSNVERGSDALEKTLKAIRKALRKSGVTVNLDASNGLIVAALRFDDPEDE